MARRHAFSLGGKGVNVRTLGWFGLVILLFLPACGSQTQTTDPAPAPAPTPKIALSAKQDLQAGLDSIALDQQHIPGCRAACA